MPLNSLYSALRAALEDARVGADAAQAHGTLTGMLCADPTLSIGRWIGVLLEDAEVERVSKEALARLSSCGENLRAALDSDALEFAPLQPDDDAPLSEHLQAMAEWVRSLSLRARGGWIR